MARRGGSKRASGTTFRSLTISLPRPIRPVVPQWVSPLSLVEDRRIYHPLGRFRPPMMVTGQRVGPLKPAGTRIRTYSPVFPPAGVKFASPKRTIICVRRQERREVLFAKRRTGGGGGKRRRNAWSNVSC